MPGTNKNLINVCYLYILLSGFKEAVIIFTVETLDRFHSRSTYHIYFTRFIILALTVLSLCMSYTCRQYIQTPDPCRTRGLFVL